MFRELASPVQLKDQDQFLPKHRDLPHKVDTATLAEWLRDMIITDCQWYLPFLKKSRILFSNCDTYINIVGGLRVDEPAIDLSIAMALISSLKDTPIDENAVVFGEIGLAGEIRAVSNAQMRINEAVRLGFTKIILPYHNLKGVSCDDAELIGVKNIRQAFEAVGQ